MFNVERFFNLISSRASAILAHTLHYISRFTYHEYITLHIWWYTVTPLHDEDNFKFADEPLADEAWTARYERDLIAYV